MATTSRKRERENAVARLVVSIPAALLLGAVIGGSVQSFGYGGWLVYIVAMVGAPVAVSFIAGKWPFIPAVLCNAVLALSAIRGSHDFLRHHAANPGESIRFQFSFDAGVFLVSIMVALFASMPAVLMEEERRKKETGGGGLTNR